MLGPGGPTGKHIVNLHDQDTLTFRAARPVAFQVDGEYMGERERDTSFHSERLAGSGLIARAYAAGGRASASDAAAPWPRCLAGDPENVADAGDVIHPDTPVSQTAD